MSLQILAGALVRMDATQMELLRIQEEARHSVAMTMKGTKPQPLSTLLSQVTAEASKVRACLVSSLALTLFAAVGAKERVRWSE